MITGAAGNHDQGDVVLDCQPRNGAYRPVSSCGDEHLSSLVHCVPRKGLRPVTRTHLADIDLPGPSGATDGGLLHART